MGELVENRDELAAELSSVISPADTSRLLSEAAVEAAECACLHAHSQELALLLLTVVEELDEVTLKSIGCNLDGIEQQVLNEVLQGNSGSKPPDQSCTPAKKSPQNQGQTTVPDKSGARTKVTAARCIS